jgi:parallel beta-helix repeat protein
MDDAAMLLTRHTFSRLLLPLILSSASSCALEPTANQPTCHVPDAANLQGNVRLQANCVYPQSLVISHSNTHLDCQGATLDGDNRRAFGVVVNSKGQPLENVSVKNCKIRDFTHSGIRITSDIPANQLSSDHQENYRRTPTKVLIDHVDVQDSGRVGIYFDAYVTDSTIKNSAISESVGSGIYLEQASKGNKIINNKIINNGNTDKSPKREGIAIDSSAYNKIISNSLSGNGLGGIFLYKNCGEKIHSGKSTIRWQHSDYNEITGNNFSNENVGVWIASRQSKNLLLWDCGDKSIDKEGHYYEDFSNNNLFDGNVFCNTDTPIIVEGDNNKIVGNFFDSLNPKQIILPITKREIFLGKKTIGNIVAKSELTICNK